LNLKAYWPVRNSQRPRTARLPVFDKHGFTRAKREIALEAIWEPLVIDEFIFEPRSTQELEVVQRHDSRPTTSCTACNGMCATGCRGSCYELRTTVTSTCLGSTYPEASGW